MIVTPEFPEHRLQDPRRQAEWRSLISAFGCRTSPTTASR